MSDKYLSRCGYQVRCSATLGLGIETGQSYACDVVLLDVDMPDGSGLDRIEDFLNLPSRPEVIIVTGNGIIDGAAQAIKAGAWSYIEKQNFIRDIDLHLIRALQFREEKQKIKTVPVALKRKDIIGNSDALNACLDQVALAAPTDAAVLITGETGTGKELFSRAIHLNSKRAQAEFVVVDCTALPEEIFESQLFGHTKGAFTGADRTRDGLIQSADKGTLFLDEIGELPLAIQKKFLRVIQEYSYRRIGSNTERQSDFRLVAATNRNLEQMAAQGAFRKDLLYRLRAFTIDLPPLRKRKEDLADLARSFISDFCERSLVDCKGFSPDFFECLACHDWPGNVRELKQVLEQAYANARSFPTLHARHLPESLRILCAQSGLAAQHTDIMDRMESGLSTWPEYKKQSELHYLQQLVRITGGDMKEACRISTISRARLYELLKKHRIQSKK